MKFLIVEDDPSVVEYIVDILDSMDIEHDAVTNVEDAKKLLANTSYACVLLDLCIPAKSGRGGASEDFGVILLTEIQRIKKPSPPPVYMMTAMLAKGFDMATNLLRLGAKDFISKPFLDNGRKLTQTIRSVLSTSETEPEHRNHVSKVAELPSPYIEPKGTSGEFVGGELVIEKNRITLCGHTVLATSRSARMVRILEVLNQRTTVGEWVAKSGPELAEAIQAEAGQNSVACSIHSFRTRITEVLRTELGLKSDNQSVISSGGSGYRFNKWITVRDAREAKPKNSQVEALPPSRRELILSLLRETGCRRSLDIATELGCSLKTVKRELDELRLAGQIKFVGPSKTGTYRLVVG
jgi:DNA-binding response OmpR family regulator